MNILAFDTTAALSVAGMRDGKIVAKNSISESGKQSEMLIPEIEKTLAQAKISYKNLQAIAVTKGPGSFTSVRIGLVAAQTLQLALKIPLIALTANEVLAFKHRDEGKKISTAINASMNEFFCAEFLIENGLPKQLGDIKLVAADDVDDDCYKDEISAELVALLAYEKIQKNIVTEDSSALYLRAPRIG